MREETVMKLGKWLGGMRDEVVIHSHIDACINEILCRLPHGSIYVLLNDRETAGDSITEYKPTKILITSDFLVI